MVDSLIYCVFVYIFITLVFMTVPRHQHLGAFITTVCTMHFKYMYSMLLQSMVLLLILFLFFIFIYLFIIFIFIIFLG